MLNKKGEPDNADSPPTQIYNNNRLLNSVDLDLFQIPKEFHFYDF